MPDPDKFEVKGPQPKSVPGKNFMQGRQLRKTMFFDFVLYDSKRKWGAENRCVFYKPETELHKGVLEIKLQIMYNISRTSFARVARRSGVCRGLPRAGRKWESRQNKCCIYCRRSVNTFPMDIIHHDTFLDQSC